MSVWPVVVPPGDADAPPPVEVPESPLFDGAMSEAQALMSLACAAEGVPDAAGEREEKLVRMALTAGILGSLSVTSER